MLSTTLSILFCAVLATTVDGFVVQSKLSRRSAVIAKASESAADLFGSEGWKPIEKELDTVPIFTCANEKGHPLQYAVDVNDESFPVPFFYCDVNDALEELKKAREETKMGNDLDIIPFPLGKAFQLWATDKAVIVPSKNAIMQAGAPPGANPLGQHVPLFACMEIMQEGENGKPVLPLFFVLEEANAAVKEATKADGGNPDDLEVVSLSLPRAVELLAGAAEGPAFQFIPPQASIKHIEEYLST